MKEHKTTYTHIQKQNVTKPVYIPHDIPRLLLMLPVKVKIMSLGYKVIVCWWLFDTTCRSLNKGNGEHSYRLLLVIWFSLLRCTLYTI